MPDSATFDPFEIADGTTVDLSEPLDAIDASNGGTGFLSSLNHFNYFTEVEDEFVRRRGYHLLVSPMDWALIQTWKDAGVPLHIVIRGINQSFDAYDKRPQKFRKINSLLYCLQEVESCNSQYRESQVGAHSDESATSQPEETGDTKSDQFSKQTVLEFLTSRYDKLKEARTKPASTQNAIVIETLNRTVSRLAEIISEIENSARLNPEPLERDLTSIEDLILHELLNSLTQDRKASIEEDGKTQLKAYKKQMPKEVYQQTLSNYVAKRVRELYGIPRLSLFYLF